MARQTYKYEEMQSIVYGLTDDFALSDAEYLAFMRFFVTYSLGQSQSMKGKTLADYGWHGNFERNGLKAKLQAIIDLYDPAICSVSDNEQAEEYFKNECNRLDLGNGVISDFSKERIAISTTIGTNNYLKFFYRVRDALAHGRFALKELDKVRYIVMQDNDSNNVKARAIVKVDTLSRLINAIDIHGILHNG